MTRPLTEAAAQVADEVLAPSAERTDAAGVVPRSHLRALTAAGLSGLFGPREYGGAEAPPDVVREVFETLAGACGVTFFVWAQHHGPVRMLAASPNAELKDRHLADLCAGRLLGGVAFAYLRRPGPPAVTARPAPGGFRVDGEAPWVTSWGLADLFLVAARMDDDVLWFLVPGASGPGLRPSEPLALAAMGASATVRVVFDGLAVPEDDLLLRQPLADWQAHDRVVTAQPNPAVFGIAATCCRLLGPDGAALDSERTACRARSYALADQHRTDDDHLASLTEARAWSYDVALRAAAALVASAGGRSMERSHPAQRLLREAAFFTIQAQTPGLRAATLARLAQPSSSWAASTPAAAE